MKEFGLRRLEDGRRLKRWFAEPRNTGHVWIGVAEGEEGIDMLDPWRQDKVNVSII